MASQYCNLCQVVISDQEDHNFGKIHQIALHKSYMAFLKEKCGVFITGWHNLIKREEIESYIQSLGKIVDLYIDPGNKFAITQFIDEETAKKVIKSKLIFKGRTLVAKPRKLKDSNNHPAKVSDTNAENDNFVALLERIKGADLYKQVRLVVDHLQQQYTGVSYNQLCSDIQRILRFYFPSCTVYPFGSTVTGLDFYGSDVDLYVHIPDVCTTKNQNENRAAFLVKATKDIFQQCSLISNIVCIPNAKTPIVKCVHRPTGISCDINFKNMLGVCNTYLIRYYLNIDYKLIPIAVILKKWGKLLDLIGPNGKISCYGLLIMFIFYLQQEPYYLPSVKCLQSDYNIREIHDHWNGGFYKKFKPTIPVLERESTCALFYGFFKFYSEFNYSLYVICPYLGKPIEKNSFLNNSKLPLGFKLYIENLSHLPSLTVDKPLCIQDPFEQNNNITKGISSKFLDEFVSSCKAAAQVFVPSSSGISLLNLFTGNAEQQKYQKSDGVWEFIWKFQKNQLYYKKDGGFSLDKKKIIWMKTAVNFIKRVLIEVLKFDVDEYEMKNQINDNESNAFKLKGVCNVNLWESRKLIQRDLICKEDLKNIIDKQIYLSNYICSDLLRNEKKSKPVLAIDLTMSFKSGLVLIIKKIYEEDSNFKSFCIFFNSNVQNWFDLYEKELNALFANQISNSNTQQNSDKSNPVISDTKIIDLVSESETPNTLANNAEVIVID